MRAKKALKMWSKVRTMKWGILWDYKGGSGLIAWVLKNGSFQARAETQKGGGKISSGRGTPPTAAGLERKGWRPLTKKFRGLYKPRKAFSGWSARKRRPWS